MKKNFFIIGIFIVSSSFVRTGVPASIWQNIIKIKEIDGNSIQQIKPFHSSTSIFFISLYILFTSQLVGNVAVVIILSNDILLLDEKTQIYAWILLAWISTGKNHI